MSVLSDRKEKNAKVALIDNYIKKIDEILCRDDLKAAEKEQDIIISVFDNEIPNIRCGLTNYEYGGELNCVYDLELLKAKLENYKASLYNCNSNGAKSTAGMEVNIINNMDISINNTIDFINKLPEDVLNEKDKELLEDKLSSIERLVRNKDKDGAKAKIINIVKWLLEKSVDALIALLPAIGSIASKLAGM